MQNCTKKFNKNKIIIKKKICETEATKGELGYSEGPLMCQNQSQ